jgi:hypothetical protein
MNKEKQIEDMAHILCGMENTCNNCMFNKVNCYERLDAEQVYKLGYRKATEIFEEIENNSYSYGINLVISKETFAELKKKYAESEDTE